MSKRPAPFDAEGFRERLRELMTAVGIPPKPTHGYAARALDLAEKRLGVPLPAALRVLYGLAAKHRALTHMHNRLLSPAMLVRVDGPFRTPLTKGRLAKIRAGTSVIFENDHEACMHGDGVVSYAFRDRNTGGYKLYAGSARAGALTAFIQRFGPFSGPRWRSAGM
jgi:hypothetical protein